MLGSYDLDADPRPGPEGWARAQDGGMKNLDSNPLILRHTELDGQVLCSEVVQHLAAATNAHGATKLETGVCRRGGQIPTKDRPTHGLRSDGADDVSPPFWLLFEGALKTNIPIPHTCTACMIRIVHTFGVVHTYW